MFDFTQQERQVILFLSAMALIGIGAGFGLKVNARLERIMKPQEESVKVDINKAALEDLAASRIISGKLAQEIVGYRAAHGPFKSMEGLEEVKGIGKYRLEKLKEVFYVE